MYCNTQQKITKKYLDKSNGYSMGVIAQSVEQFPFKELVLGSSPNHPTMSYNVILCLT